LPRNTRFSVLVGILLVAALIASAQQALNNDAIVKMVKAGLGEDLIVSTIRTQPGNYDVDPDHLIALKSAGVSEKVLNAMVEKKSATAAPSGAASDPPTPSANPNDPNAPHDPGIYMYTSQNSGGKLTLLEPTVYTQGKSGGVFASAMTYGIAKVKWKAVVRDAHANTRTSDPSAVFYFYFEEKNAGLSQFSFGGTSTPNEFTLLRFDVKATSRETVVMQANAFGSSEGTDDKANVPFTHVKIRPGVYKVTPSSPLKPGEYGFLSAMAMGAFAPGAAGANRVFDFGVNPAQ